MSKIDAIKKAIETLPDEEYSELRNWFSEKDWRSWDEQIVADSRVGRLDFLVKESLLTTPLYISKEWANSGQFG